ncbi:hypothetical protein JCM10212_004353 [Sporobolomyces blumeae]
MSSTAATSASASSASDSTPLPRGKCVVCGEVTSKRCSACAAHGTDWMFFCSEEHQKLVWRTHRRVCGADSNPFQWPFFTKKEHDEWIEVGTRPRPWRENGKSFAQDLFAIPDLTGSGLGSIMSLIADGPFSMVADERYRFFQARTEPYIFQVLGRGTTLSASQPRLDPHDLRKMSYQDPFAYLLSFETDSWSDIEYLRDAGPWWTVLHHKLLIYYTLATAPWGPSPVDVPLLYRLSNLAADEVVSSLRSIDDKRYKGRLSKFRRDFEREVVLENGHIKERFQL